MELVFHAQVWQEYDAALMYYEQQSAGLAQTFSHEFTLAVEDVAKSPTRFPYLEKPFRRARIGRFPFRIVYSLEETVIIVWALMHERQAPGYWLTRLP